MRSQVKSWIDARGVEARDAVEARKAEWLGWAKREDGLRCMVLADDSGWTPSPLPRVRRWSGRKHSVDVLARPRVAGVDNRSRSYTVYLFE